MTVVYVALLSFALGLLSATLKTRWDEHCGDRRRRRMIARALIPEVKEISGSMMYGDPIRWGDIEFPANSWPRHHDALAEAIPKRKAKQWLGISGVFEEVRDIAEEAERYQSSDELDEWEVQRLQDLYDSVRRALVVLHRYAGVPKPPRRARRIRRRMRWKEQLRSLKLV